MSYREEYREANEEVRERYELVMERIVELRGEQSVDEKYRPYFRRLADIFMMVDSMSNNRFTEFRDYITTYNLVLMIIVISELNPIYCTLFCVCIL